MFRNGISGSLFGGVVLRLRLRDPQLDQHVAERDRGCTGEPNDARQRPQVGGAREQTWHNHSYIFFVNGTSLERFPYGKLEDYVQILALS